MATTKTYSLMCYRYQRDSPGHIRPHVPKEEWRMYATNANSQLRIVITQVHDNQQRLISLNLNVVDGEESRPGGIILLEKLNLVEFSRPGIPHSSPIKAVHGGKQLGFRYIQPLSGSPSTQYFKRFQLTFQTDADCQAVVSAIQIVCPVSTSDVARKEPTLGVNLTANTVPTQKKRKLDEVNGSVKTYPEFSAPGFSSQLATEHCTNVPSSGRPLPGPQLEWKDALVSTQQTGMDGNTHSGSKVYQPNMEAYSGNPSLHIPALSLPTTSPIAQYHSSPMPVSSQIQALGSSQVLPSTHSSSDPTQRTPLSHLSNLLAPPVHPEGTHSTQKASGEPQYGNIFTQLDPLFRPRGAPIRTPVTEEANLNALSEKELEQAVMQVISEPGFIDLMGKLEKMYAIRGFVNDTS
ncbi:SubName: Full=Uncharacterized protein {ECO:0000313/EMBL:CCA72432.1} [Serendipita indica DSM 11827]|nr:SubName: Full=Uncharacterized protein {ECO:0000313/EMBL:CCA72432.1} [Serendipita indica DSM 11827]